MPPYVTLHRFTQQGIQNIKESPDRITAAKEAAGSLGVQLRGVYVTMGQYDLVAVSEAPDDETMARFSIALASRGNVTTETLRGFSEDEFRDIVNALP